MTLKLILTLVAINKRIQFRFMVAASGFCVQTEWFLLVVLSGYLGTGRGTTGVCELLSVLWRDVLRRNANQGTRRETNLTQERIIFQSRKSVEGDV